MTATTALLRPAPELAPRRARPALRLVPKPALPPLADTERHAVMLGRGDACRLGWDGRLARSRVGRLLTRLTGLRGVTPLADPRLERFRLFGAMMRRDDRRAPAMAAELAALGVPETALREAIGLALG